MYGCDDIRERLSEFVDDVLSPEEKTEFEKHINSCEGCQAELDALESLIKEINQLPFQQLPDGFEEQLRGRLMAEAKAYRYKSLIKNWKTYSSVAAGIILVLLLRTGYYNTFVNSDTAYVKDKPLTITEDTVGTKKEAKEEGAAPKATAETKAEPDRPSPTPSQSQKPKKAGSQSANNSMAAASTFQSREEEAGQAQDAPYDSSAAGPFEKTEEYSAAQSDAPAQPLEDSASMKSRMYSAEIAADTTISALSEDNNSFADAIDEAPARGGASFKGDDTASADMKISASDVMPSAPNEYSFAAAHDQENPEYVSVRVEVEDFDTVARHLGEKYKTSVRNGQLVLDLDHDDFNYVMNYLVSFGAIVTQDDSAGELTSNRCTIVAKKQ